MKEDWSDILNLGTKSPIKIHLIGVAGSGMSGIAGLLLSLGHTVSGSDKADTKETERLIKLGLTFCGAHSPEQVNGVDLVVYSSAIKQGNVVYDKAKELGIPMIRRAEALAAIMSEKKSIIVAGTHGKTTTSALAAKVLRGGEKMPSHYVGAEVPILGTNAFWNSESDFFIAEGDESDGSLINYNPEYAILLNVEEDHLDYYKDGIQEIRLVFDEYLNKCSNKIIYCSEDLEAKRLCSKRSNAISYGFDNKDDIWCEIEKIRESSTDFTVYAAEKKLGSITLGVPGKHNVLNALAVVALANELGMEFSGIAQSMAEFRGARRRFDMLYKSSNYSIVDDYGHHPTEIEATIGTAKQLNPERLVCVFQPHRYTRTKLMLDKFSGAFSGVDKLFITEVYAAGEAPIVGADSNAIVESIRKSTDVEVELIQCFESAHHVIGAYIKPGDQVLILGAGNVHEIGSLLARDLEVIDKLRRELDDPMTECRLYEPMRRHTTLKVGGPAQYWVEPITVESFSKSLGFFDRLNIPVRVIGRGSNLLICDGGIQGAVIHPSGGEFSEVSVSGNYITAGVGARFKKLNNIAKMHEISGFEWMEGIPGNVGGGLRMNAGAMGTETFDQVVSVKFLDSSGQIYEKSSHDVKSEYRSVPELNNNYAISAVFEGVSGNVRDIEKLTQESMSKRKQSQPIAASAGCIFKNPESIPAGKLIEEMDMKGFSVGGARVSDVHGNFIVNDGKATAIDVLSVINEIKQKALNSRGIKLETEVQIIGEEEIVF